jgi:hypothetical protein
MYMGSKRNQLLAIVLILGASGLRAEDNGDSDWIQVSFPSDGPVDVVSYNLGKSTASVRGVSLALNLHTSLTLRNNGDKRIRGLTLLVEAPDLTPSGRASVMTPTLDVAPGANFPVRLDLELLRPFGAGRSGTPLVNVTLDCVLFDDLSAYGLDRIRSKRSLLVYELEARRDRSYYRALVDRGQLAKLQQEMDFGLPESRVPQLGFELLNDIRLNTRPSRPVHVASVSFPDSPLQMLDGVAKVFGNEVQTPGVELRNRSQKTTQSVEVGWILRDNHGKGYMAGTMPQIVSIGPVQQARVQQSGILRLSHPSGTPVLITALAAYVRNVQFTDGDVWIPSRSDIANSDMEPYLKHEILSSPEQQRLSAIYRRSGMSGLAAELTKAKD